MRMNDRYCERLVQVATGSISCMSGAYRCSVIACAQTFRVHKLTLLRVQPSVSLYKPGAQLLRQHACPEGADVKRWR